MSPTARPFVEFLDVLGVQLTPAQRTLVRVAVDGVEPEELEPEERALAARLFGPVERFPASARSVLVAVVGARSGKTYILGALYSLWRALTADLRRLAPGEQASALVVAPDLRLARQAIRYAVGAAESVPAIARCIDAKSSDGFVLVRPDGARVAIEALPATRGGSAVRGRSLVSAVLDEAAFFRDDSAVVNDVEIFRAVAPRVLPGGLVVLASTPWLEQGLLYTEHSANWGTPRSAMAALGPTSLLREGDEAIESMLERERERDPQNAAREYDAEFVVGGAGLLFGPELLGPALDRDVGLDTTAPAVVGGDIGLERDASAFVAVAREGRALRVVDALELRPKRGAPLKLSEVVCEACAFARRHGAHQIHVDHHVLGPAREHADGVLLKAVPGGADEKEKRYLAVREQFRQSAVRVPGCLTRLTVELGAIASKPKPGGGHQIIIPRRGGSHMDLQAAFILAAWRASLQGGNRMLRALETASQRGTLDSALGILSGGVHHLGLRGVR